MNAPNDSSRGCRKVAAIGLTVVATACALACLWLCLQTVFDKSASVEAKRWAQSVHPCRPAACRSVLASAQVAAAPRGPGSQMQGTR